MPFAQIPVALRRHRVNAVWNDLGRLDPSIKALSAVGLQRRSGSLRVAHR
ncbi:hypothetical protein [Nesterenkonia xinjiangensis]|uniref:Uncharacterized protein n=1 Tax=Nesterenkonia xinjiangensis TaxID=225327 RepID=A0A7Z0KAK7_9MICC|nr:hypothetical protein [Nesterenkonia xinjiangensis]NYJ76717.1 hypothetical protein [Nesterenkonia xinjiangensis]